MKKWIYFNIVSLLLIVSCDDIRFDDVPPSPPTNIRTITGDERVDIYWDHSPESDVAGYNVYYSYSYDGRYTLIGSTDDNYFVDTGCENGVTYYYAVTAYDYNNNESELSRDVVYDTPRPEGFNQAVFDYHVSPNNSGYDFSNYQVVAYNDESADFFFEYYDGKYYITVWEDTDIQDMGLTNDIYDISYAPVNGWVSIKPGENIKYTEAIVGHTYVIWTWDNHYAKIRIKNITRERMVFDWAYQLAEGNRELKRNATKFDRNNMPKSISRN
ncbi:fibronectin type III domain-containing protein [Rosettibacter firmus]|uniref:fibronectin type III domain-containing protein n=1 Tax=Rosettibacter firmus TaxID=3111522 RepID=UPI00336C2EFB